MQEVSFEWANGPCANAAFAHLSVYDLLGNKIEYRQETIKYHKNGKWSYSDLRIFVPVHSIVWQVEQSTHATRTTDVWQATEDRRVPIAHIYGKWADMRDWPPLPKNVFVNEEQWRGFLEKTIKKDVIEQWKRNASIKSI